MEKNGLHLTKNDIVSLVKFYARKVVKKEIITYNIYVFNRGGVLQSKIWLRQKIGTMFYVYALLSDQNKDIYIGYSEDLKKRFNEHNNGLVKATKGYRPWKLVYYKAYVTKLDATRREVQLKKNHRSKEDLRIQIRNCLQSK